MFSALSHEVTRLKRVVVRRARAGKSARTGEVPRALPRRPRTRVSPAQITQTPGRLTSSPAWAGVCGRAQMRSCRCSSMATASDVHDSTREIDQRPLDDGAVPGMPAARAGAGRAPLVARAARWRPPLCLPRLLRTRRGHAEGRGRAPLGGVRPSPPARRRRSAPRRNPGAPARRFATSAATSRPLVELVRRRRCQWNSRPLRLSTLRRARSWWHLASGELPGDAETRRVVQDRVRRTSAGSAAISVGHVALGRSVQRAARRRRPPGIQAAQPEHVGILLERKHLPPPGPAGAGRRNSPGRRRCFQDRLAARLNQADLALGIRVGRDACAVGQRLDAVDFERRRTPLRGQPA